jgi:rhizosphere induced protein
MTRQLPVKISQNEEKIMNQLNGPELAAAQPYTLTAINNSTNQGNFCVFQQDPDLGVSNVLSLAWFSKFAHPSTTVKFTWTIEYNFVWSETGVLTPGVMFDASQTFDADLQNSNQITLTYAGGYNFVNQTKGPKPGILYIKEDATIPPKQASVGIGMSGFGTFVVQAQPNLNLNFSPHPRYYIAFGNFIQGEVLDISEMTNVAEILFATNVYSMTAILGEDNGWTIKSTKALNALVANARASDATLTFNDVPRLLLGESGTRGSITDVAVADANGQFAFTDKTADKKGDDIFVTSLQHPTKPPGLEPGDTYTITGMSGKNPIRPITAMYMSKTGNVYKFTKV